MKDLEKGDVVVFEDREYGYVEYDALNETHVIEDADGNQFFAEIDEDSLSEETAAATSIQGKPTPATSKSMMMAQLNSALATMDQTEATEFFDQMMAQIGNEAPSIAPGQAGSNKATVDAKGKAVKEDLQQLFGSENLSEEFQLKTQTLFEAAVNTRVTEQVEEYREQLDEEFVEKVAELEESATDQIDSYLTEAVNEWIAENELAIEQSMTYDLNESFMLGLKNLFEQHYIEIPEDRVDILEQLSEERDELEEIANEALLQNKEMAEVISEFNRQQIVEEIIEDMPLSEAEKIRELSENIDFDGDEELYAAKVGVLKEHYETNKKNRSTENGIQLFEEVNIDNDDDQKHVDPRVARYVSAIDRAF